MFHKSHVSSVVSDLCTRICARFYVRLIMRPTVFICIYTLFNAAQRDMECFNLQLQMHNVLIF